MATQPIVYPKPTQDVIFQAIMADENEQTAILMLNQKSTDPEVHRYHKAFCDTLVQSLINTNAEISNKPTKWKKEEVQAFHKTELVKYIKEVVIPKLQVGCQQRTELCRKCFASLYTPEPTGAAATPQAKAQWHQTKEALWKNAFMKVLNYKGSKLEHLKGYEAGFDDATLNFFLQNRPAILKTLETLEVIKKNNGSYSLDTKEGKNLGDLLQLLFVQKHELGTKYQACVDAYQAEKATNSYSNKITQFQRLLTFIQENSDCKAFRDAKAFDPNKNTLKGTALAASKQAFAGIFTDEELLLILSSPLDILAETCVAKNCANRFAIQSHVYAIESKDDKKNANINWKNFIQELKAISDRKAVEAQAAAAQIAQAAAAKQEAQIAANRCYTVASEYLTKLLDALPKTNPSLQDQPKLVDKLKELQIQNFKVKDQTKIVFTDEELKKIAAHPADFRKAVFDHGLIKEVDIDSTQPALGKYQETQMVGTEASHKTRWIQVFETLGVAKIASQAELAKQLYYALGDIPRSTEQAEADATAFLANSKFLTAYTIKENETETKIITEEQVIIMFRRPLGTKALLEAKGIVTGPSISGLVTGKVIAENNLQATWNAVTEGLKTKLR